MQTRKCYSCKEIFNVSEFRVKEIYKNGNIAYQSRCKPCQLLYQRDHYKKNKDRYFEWNKEREDKLSKEFKELKENTPCKDCGVKYPHYVMDFDHLPGFEKIMEVSLMIHRYTSREKIYAEIAKCDLVCSNCHRVRTYSRNKTL